MPFGLSQREYNAFTDDQKRQQSRWWRSLSPADQRKAAGMPEGTSSQTANPQKGGMFAPGLSTQVYWGTAKQQERSGGSQARQAPEGFGATPPTLPDDPLVETISKTSQAIQNNPEVQVESDFQKLLRLAKDPKANAAALEEMGAVETKAEPVQVESDFQKLMRLAKDPQANASELEGMGAVSTASPNPSPATTTPQQQGPPQGSDVFTNLLNFAQSTDPTEGEGFVRAIQAGGNQTGQAGTNMLRQVIDSSPEQQQAAVRNMGQFFPPPKPPPTAGGGAPPPGGGGGLPPVGGGGPLPTGGGGSPPTGGGSPPTGGGGSPPTGGGPPPPLAGGGPPPPPTGPPVQPIPPSTPLGTGAGPLQQAALGQLQQFTGQQLGPAQSSAQVAEQQRRIQSQALDQRLEDVLNQRISGLGQNDAITQGRLADFESQSGRNRAQLEEDLNRLGILTTGGDTADQLQEFVTGMERGRQQIIGEGQARQERAFQDALGLLQSRRQDLGLQLGSEQTDRDLALRQVLGLGGLQQDESQFGRDLALRQELGRGGLGLQRDDLALRSELGRGRLGLDEELGRGRLGLEGRDLDLRTELGRGQLGVSRDDLALRSELGRGQLGLGRDRLGLDRELGQGRLGLGRDQLSLDEELGRLRSDLGFQQLGLGREQLGAQVARDQAADARAADQLGLGYDQLGAQIARDRAADARRAEEIGISRGDQAIQRREAGDKRLGKALGGLGGMAERVAGLLPGGGIASKVLKIFSDEALKDELRPVPEDQLLETLKSVPVQTWKYKGENEYHIGPTAQDFSKLGFDTGDRPRTIDMADYIGVALGAVKALDAKILAEKEHKWFEG